VGRSDRKAGELQAGELENDAIYPLLRTVDAVEADEFSLWWCRTSRVSPSRTETTGPVKSNASWAEKVEMKKPHVDTSRISSLRLQGRATNIPLTPKMKQKALFRGGICA